MRIFEEFEKLCRYGRGRPCSIHQKHFLLATNPPASAFKHARFKHPFEDANIIQQSSLEGLQFARAKVGNVQLSHGVSLSRPAGHLECSTYSSRRGLLAVGDQDIDYVMVSKVLQGSSIPSTHASIDEASQNPEITRPFGDISTLTPVRSRCPQRRDRFLP